MDKEMDRMVAVLKGDFVARVFPQFWHAVDQFREKDADKLRRQLEKKFKDMDDRRKARGNK